MTSFYPHSFLSLPHLFFPQLPLFPLDALLSFSFTLVCWGFNPPPLTHHFNRLLGPFPLYPSNFCFVKNTDLDLSFPLTFVFSIYIVYTLLVLESAQTSTLE
ncbi:hypothetical protein N658DRAFT_250916 [Parathielavia hyrcaniae]|uniref:Uncharacterized protein n=1 Tax=Parathielavia hyrcaniae TaxID=113614 RepID=A0AAN6Q681_9PEZI|nr:hypothetical protein N658DRAFT_250916 [Parathielavia hyrcaniae]